MVTTIAIIGAGCAGLGAADELLTQKNVAVDIRLLDANDWIGGRARTSTVPGLPVDLGPQFIQDPEINPWKIILENMEGYDGKVVGPQFMEPLYRTRLGDKWVTVESNVGIRMGNDELSEQYQSATAYKNAPIMTGNAPDFCKGQEDLRLALGSSGYGAIAESAEPWQYVVSDQARQRKVDSAGNLYVTGGLGTLVEKYGEKLLSIYDNLKFVGKAVVVSISTGEIGVSIRTADDKELVCDFCIVTIPTPEIKKIKFTPSLSGEMMRADEFINLGSYKKVAFKPTSFPVGDQQKKAEERDSIEEDYEYFIYDREQDGVWQYFRLPTDPDILICVTAGDFARRLDDVPDNTVSASVINLLKGAYATGNFTPQQNAKVVTNWTKTAHIHGAYSYTAYDSRLDRDNPFPFEAREKIAKPHGRVYFAGEATWVEAYGTIHGAYRSGERAARAILKVLRG